MKAPSPRLHLRLADTLGMAILRGDYPAGKVLPPELQLSEEFGISRTALRETLRKLIAKGMLESRPKRGTLVRDPLHWNHLDPDLLRWRIATAPMPAYLDKILALRRATAPEAAALAARDALPEDRVRLLADFQAMVDAGPDDAAWVEAHLAFHRSIYVATRNEFFWPIGEMLAVALRQGLGDAGQGARPARAIPEHGDLCAAIVAGKPDLARAAALTLLADALTDPETDALTDAETDSGAGSGR